MFVRENDRVISLNPNIANKENYLMLQTMSHTTKSVSKVKLGHFITEVLGDFHVVTELMTMVV